MNRLSTAATVVLPKGKPDVELQGEIKIPRGGSFEANNQKPLMCLALMQKIMLLSQHKDQKVKN